MVSETAGEVILLWLLDVNMAAMQVGLEWMTGCGGDRDFSVVAAGVEASLAEGECGWRAEVRQRREEGVMVLLSGDGCPSHKAHECVVCHTLFVSGSGGDPSSKGLTRLESRQWRVHQWVLENYLCRWVFLFDFLHVKRKKKKNTSCGLPVFVLVLQGRVRAAGRRGGPERPRRVRGAVGECCGKGAPATVGERGLHSVPPRRSSTTGRPPGARSFVGLRI